LAESGFILIKKRRDVYPSQRDTSDADGGVGVTAGGVMHYM